ncbi:MAG: MMPL family transporter, partial [Pseudomonadota bacterium]
VDVSLTGKIALNAEELKSVSSGASLAGVLSLALVTLVLFFGTRSVRAVIAMVINLLVGLIMTGAAALLLFGALNIISVAFAVLFIGLGIDFAIHLMLRAREEASERGLAPALVHAAGTSGLALALCAPTTALAFLSFTPTDYAGLSQLGVIAAIGVFVALLSSVTLLPALLILLCVPAGRGSTPRAGQNRFGHKAIVIGTALLLVPAAYLATQMRFSADPIALKDPTAPSVQVYQRLLAQEGFSPHVIHVLAQTPKGAAALAAKAEALAATGRVVWDGSFVPKEQPDKLELIEETNFLLASDLVSQAAIAPVDIPSAQRAMARLAKVAPSIVFDMFLKRAKAEPGLWDTLAQALLSSSLDLRETLTAQLKTQGVSADDVPDALRQRYRGTDGSFRVEIFPKETIGDEKALARYVEAVTSVFPNATGSPVQIVRSGEIVEGAMIQAVLTAFALVSVFLLVMLRSFKQVVFVLTPVVIAGVVTMAAAVLLGLSFNFANVIVLPLLLGLGVDAGIHYVRRAFEGSDAEVSETGSTGRAVLLSALTTIGSFGTLMVSRHAGTASMGQLLTLALICLMVATLVVLPALLRWRVKTRGAGA